jgi:hypothetical protein
MEFDDSQIDLNKGVINSIIDGNMYDLAGFLHDGGSPQACDGRGLSALHLAVYHHRPDMARLLLQRDADIHAQSPTFGYTALHYAINRSNMEMVELLLSFNADIHARTKNNQTTLHRAATAGSLKICQLLVERGADLTAIDDTGRTPLMAVQEHFCGAKTPKRYIETGAFLAEQEAMMRDAAEKRRAAAWRDAHRDSTKRFRLKP